jgi:hypothetical protein
MNRILRALVATGTLALTAGLTAEGQDQNLTLQQAIDLIETAGNSERAIFLLEQAAKGPDTTVAAQALFYLAREQEHRDAALALRTYERIVSDFAGVTEVASAAAGRVSTLQAASPQPTLVCELCADLSGAVSADGRLMTTIKTLMTDGDIGVLDLETQQVTPLQIQGSRQEQGGQTLTGAALFPVFSPDNTQIAYFWAQGRTAPAELRVTSRQPRSQARTLAGFRPGVDLNGAFPMAWLPNGTLITVVTRPDQKTELHAVSTVDGTMRQIVSLDWRTIPQGARDASASADGRFLAYRALATSPTARVSPQQALSMDQQIYVVPVSGGSEVAVTNGAGQKKSPVWTPDGRHVLYLSDVSGAWDL